MLTFIHFFAIICIKYLFLNPAPRRHSMQISRRLKYSCFVSGTLLLVAGILAFLVGKPGPSLGFAAVGAILVGALMFHFGGSCESDSAR